MMLHIFYMTFLNNSPRYKNAAIISVPFFRHYRFLIACAIIFRARRDNRLFNAEAARGLSPLVSTDSRKKIAVSSTAMAQPQAASQYTACFTKKLNAGMTEKTNSPMIDLYHQQTFLLNHILSVFTRTAALF